MFLTQQLKVQFGFLLAGTTQKMRLKELLRYFRVSLQNSLRCPPTTKSSRQARPAEVRNQLSARAFRPLACPVVVTLVANKQTLISSCAPASALKESKILVATSVKQPPDKLVALSELTKRPALPPTKIRLPYNLLLRTSLCW